MLRFMRLASVTLEAVLSSFMAMVVFSYQATASPKQELPTPVCHMTIADGRTIDLSQLCGKTASEANNSTNSVINLDQDANGGSISNTLDDEMKYIKFAQDKDAAIDDLFNSNRLNYSPKTHTLIQQVEALQQRLVQTEDEAEILQISSQLQELEQQMRQDPNYVKVEEALLTTDTP